MNKTSVISKKNGDRSGDFTILISNSYLKIRERDISIMLVCFDS